MSLTFLPCILLTTWLFYREFLATQRGFPGGSAGKESACQCRRCGRLRFDPWVGKTTPPPHNPPTEEGMASHSSILAWRIPWTEEPGRATGPRRVAAQRAEGIAFCWWPCATGREECLFVFNIYLTASSLNCGTQDVSLLHTDSSCGGLAQ